MKLRLLLLPLLLVSGLGLSACGSSVNTNSRSYNDGYSAGYDARRGFGTGVPTLSESDVCNTTPGDFNNPAFSAYGDNATDFNAGCHDGWKNGQ